MKNYPFRRSEQVICINAEGQSNCLTPGKTYSIIRCWYEQKRFVVSVIGDNWLPITGGLFAERFKSLRQAKLEKIQNVCENLRQAKLEKIQNVCEKGKINKKHTKAASSLFEPSKK